MQKLALFGLIACLVTGPVAAKSIKKMVFSPTDSEALVLVEERDGSRGGAMTFVQVDLAGLTRGDTELIVDKTTDGRLRTANPGLQTRGEGLMIPRNMSRFSVGKGAPGDYALVEFSYYNGIASVSACPAGGVPVFRFRPGQANLVAAEMLPAGGGASNILAYAPAKNGSNADLADAQEILNEHPTLRATVATAEFLGRFAFRNEKGQVSPCGSGRELVRVD